MSHKTDSRRTAVREALQGYAWPGGYPLALLMADNECICQKCVKSEVRSILRACRDSDASNSPDRDWLPEQAFVNWEDHALYCAHCNARIESAYAEE